MEKDKKDMIRYQVNCYIDEILDVAESMSSLDYFNIEISNHRGKLNVEYKLKNRKKVY